MRKLAMVFAMIGGALTTHVGSLYLTFGIVFMIVGLLEYSRS